MKINIKLIVFDNIFRFAIPNINLPPKGEAYNAFKCKSLWAGFQLLFAYLSRSNFKDAAHISLQSRLDLRLTYQHIEDEYRTN